MTIGNQTLDSFLEELGSSAPVPGGGAASAIAGALAAGLIAMVAELSASRPKYAPFAATIKSARRDGHRLEKEMVALADQDAAAFTRFMEASGLPRATPEEAALRKAALRFAALVAIEPPRRIVAACREVASANERLAGRSNLGLASDLIVASRLIEGAAQGAVENVLVNLPWIGDDAAAGALEAEVRMVARSVTRLARATRAHVARRSLRDPERSLDKPERATTRGAGSAR